jgi:hypothetical protein
MGRGDEGVSKAETRIVPHPRTPSFILHSLFTRRQLREGRILFETVVDYCTAADGDLL